jgi:hypothetical protein
VCAHVSHVCAQVRHSPRWVSGMEGPEGYHARGHTRAHVSESHTCACESHTSGWMPRGGMREEGGERGGERKGRRERSEEGENEKERDGSKRRRGGEIERRARHECSRGMCLPWSQGYSGGGERGERRGSTWEEGGKEPIIMLYIMIIAMYSCVSCHIISTMSGLTQTQPGTQILGPVHPRVGLGRTRRESPAGGNVGRAE